MKKADIIAIIINASVLITAFAFLGKMFWMDIQIDYTVTSPGIFVVFIIAVIAAHFCKMSRLFLIMLEQKIRPALFMETYAKTAFVNLIIPFKLGEIYRFYCLSVIGGNYKIGLLSVIIDRFFDTLGLVLFIVPTELIFIGGLTTTTSFLIVFLMLCAIIYMAFPSIYTYLNKFLILNTRTKKSVKALAVLEEFQQWYNYSQSLLKGRIAVIFVLSILAWGMEYAAMASLYYAADMSFVAENFASYINSIFAGSTQPMTYIYFALSGVILAVAALIFYIVTKTKKVVR